MGRSAQAHVQYGKWETLLSLFAEHNFVDNTKIRLTGVGGFMLECAFMLRPSRPVTCQPRKAVRCSVNNATSAL